MSEKRWVHVIRIPIRWGDMDAMGHVNNTTYFEYFQQARVEWLLSAGCAPDGASGEGPVIVQTHCSFLRQMRYPGEIEVHTAVGKVGRSSIETMHRIVHADAPDVVCAEGGATIVWANYRDEKSVPVPDVLRAMLDGLG